MIITIDTGTTNTRVALFEGKQRVDQVKANVGVRNTSIDGNNQLLINTISEAIVELKNKHSLQDSDIQAILAAGMITSNLGLYEVPHLVAPVSLEGFATNIKSVVIPSISTLPIHFIPGVKNLDTDNLQSVAGLDIMRGEEVEALAIADLFDIEQDAVIALPGSHSKFVSIDSKQAIQGCCTTLAGELNAIITSNTILTSSLENRFSDSLCNEALLEGYQAAESFGIGHALFQIRLKEQFEGKSHEQLASFLIGVVLHSDIKALRSAPQLGFTSGTPVYIGGSGLLCEATAVLVKHLFPEAPVYQCNDTQDLSAVGSMYIAKKANII
ncbi:2-dehydro-3-deoxygalactonokinase [Vibrio superstes]|uniref:2-dehydro-3-deoxygalactonokinase n=1 Tax=Vibrio superstes NBRC 103154 TaxID=1219062 RepID=A0A511QP22_9VIBR|nr:2-dehydro-3-deoxygalactonokinase [Vibrio superstes]GEM79081.1 2-dehydro-3-deoxygalactonokinase [Vibrio superstes NBRC 103154]